MHSCCRRVEVLNQGQVSGLQFNEVEHGGCKLNLVEHHSEKPGSELSQRRKGQISPTVQIATSWAVSRIHPKLVLASIIEPSRQSTANGPQTTTCNSRAMTHGV